MSVIVFKILSPEEAKKRARASVAEWLRQKEIEEKKARIAGRKEKEPDKPSFPAPATEPISRIDWQNLDLDKVETMITNANGVPAWEAIEQANKEGKIIIPNCMHDRMLVETEHWKIPEINAGYWAWTGTGVIYEAPNKPFGDWVVFGWEDENVKYSVSFSIPKQFHGKKNCVLVVEHPDFELKNLGNNRFELKAKDENLIHLLENFPKEDGWHHYEEKFRIPVGEPVDSSNQNANYLLRIDDGSYVGLLARCFGGDCWQGANAIWGLSDCLGVHMVALPVPGFEFPVGVPKK